MFSEDKLVAGAEALAACVLFMGLFYGAIAWVTNDIVWLTQGIADIPGRFGGDTTWASRLVIGLAIVVTVCAVASAMAGDGEEGEEGEEALSSAHDLAEALVNRLLEVKECPLTQTDVDGLLAYFGCATIRDVPSDELPAFTSCAVGKIHEKLKKRNTQ